MPRQPQKKAVTRSACHGVAVLRCLTRRFHEAQLVRLGDNSFRAKALASRACRAGSNEACVLGAKLFVPASPHSLLCTRKPKPLCGELERAEHVALENACEAGHLNACVDLASLWLEGTPVARDVAKAVDAYRRACDLGSADGCKALAGAYKKGTGVEQNMERARYFYFRACLGGVACSKSEALDD